MLNTLVALLLTDKKRSQGRIIGGLEVFPHSLPYHVGLSCRPDLNEAVCGGALISLSYVLTAAHCTSKCQIYYAFIGDHDRSKPKDPSTQVIKVQRITKHPKYYTNRFLNKRGDFCFYGTYDFALLSLRTAAEQNDYVKPICIPENDAPFVGGKLVASGWGRTDAGDKNRPSRLRSIELTLKSSKSCVNYLTSINSQVSIDPNTVLCFLYDQKKGPHHGDSGGPLAAVDEKGGKVLLGVGSFINYPALGFFSRVNSVRNWIYGNSDAQNWAC